MRPSFLTNCVVNRRKGDPSDYLFSNTPSGISVHLNGYAIIPLSEYSELIGKDFSSIIKKSLADDKDMNEMSTTNNEEN